MFINSKGLQIIGCGLSVPKKVVSNSELYPNTANWVTEKLGIDSRHYIESEKSLVDYCIDASRDALKIAGIDSNEIDGIIVATSTADYINPSMAAIIHGAIRAKEKCAAFDIQAVCAGFVYALGIAASLGASGAGKYFLVIGADQFSKITDFESRDCVFFGDAAAAVVVEITNKDTMFALELFSDGSKWEDFHTLAPAGKFSMNSKAVSSMASLKIPEAVLAICEKTGIDVKKISYFFTHQPSKAVLDSVEKRLNISEGKLFRNLQHRGNTASASIPSVFFDSNMFSKISDGEIICFAAIGAGWVWGVALLEWRRA